MPPANKQDFFMEVPFRSPLPAFCPLCNSPAEKVLTIKAWEGIPFVLTFSIKVRIPYCRDHHKKLTWLQWRQWIAIAGAVGSPFAILMLYIVFPEWSLQWLFYIGCACSGVFLGHAFYF